jgi:putative transcriptional regulator
MLGNDNDYQFVSGYLEALIWMGILKNNLKNARAERKLSQMELAELVGVSRNTISSIETGQFNPTAKLALLLCIALEKKFEELFYF